MKTFFSKSTPCVQFPGSYTYIHIGTKLYPPQNANHGSLSPLYLPSIPTPSHNHTMLTHSNSMPAICSGYLIIFVHRRPTLFVTPQISVSSPDATTTSSFRKMVWYKNSMHPLCMLVQTKRGPTPLNHPPRPSCLYIIPSPVNTDDVSSLGAPRRGLCVEGEEVEMLRFVSFCFIASVACVI